MTRFMRRREYLQLNDVELTALCQRIRLLSSLVLLGVLIVVIQVMLRQMGMPYYFPFR